SADAFAPEVLSIGSALSLLHLIRIGKAVIRLSRYGVVRAEVPATDSGAICCLAEDQPRRKCSDRLPNRNRENLCGVLFRLKRSRPAARRRQTQEYHLRHLRLPASRAELRPGEESCRTFTGHLRLRKPDSHWTADRSDDSKR